MENSNRINIHYFGEKPSKEEIAKIKADVAYHLGDAPSDASLCCCISGEDQGYAVNMQIHSAGGHIFIHRESRSLEQVLKFVYQSMKDSFEKWHRDPQHFAKQHPLTQNPCRTASHKVIECPLYAVSHSDYKA